MPTTISTDVHVAPPEHTVYQMPDLISTFITLGISLKDAVAAKAVRKAQAIVRQVEFGSLQVGMAGNMAVFSEEEGRFPYTDAARHCGKTRLRLVPKYTTEGGTIVWSKR
jgi:predicted amidohydrolase